MVQLRWYPDVAAVFPHLVFRIGWTIPKQPHLGIPTHRFSICISGQCLQRGGKRLSCIGFSQRYEPYTLGVFAVVVSVARVQLLCSRTPVFCCLRGLKQRRDQPRFCLVLPTTGQALIPCLNIIECQIRQMRRLSVFGYESLYCSFSIVLFHSRYYNAVISS